MSSTRDEDARNKRLFDIRTVERNIKKGLITRKDYEKYVKSLADVSALVAPPDTGRLDDDDDEDDDDDDDELTEADGEPGRTSSTP
jgi:hypothetical protein